ncbi:hypothetical protein GH5_02222 [Leishmania sp. Ghana 2012 LV757]|uniref:hypothetical protein n=1 Tax=Leishmania sp. Ghana 2012 LV757 TaxID=2803181 RepID=UPI001B7535A0|nr:hypothetical protein GH5_02222 [Leishmania sp. Ghana 2012 LV757]
MDAAGLFHERQADVAAFAALVFSQPTPAVCKPRTASAPASSTVPATAIPEEAVPSSPPLARATAVKPAYRRPASANVPVSRVLQEVKARVARKTRKTTTGASPDLSGRLAYAAAGASRSEASLFAMGFSAQAIRDRTYLWMSDPGSHFSSADDISRRAASESSVLTPLQQAKLQRLRIKRTHQRLLSHAQWILWLRRRRRLWHRRRPAARRRHLARQLALEYGRPIGPCCCCRRRRHAAQPSAPAPKARQPLLKAARRAVTQWLPSHSRLVKRFHYRIVSLAVQPSVAHVSLSTTAASASAPHDSRAAFSSTASCETRRARRWRLRASCAARVAIPCEPARKDHRFLQRWATAIAAQQRRRLSCCSNRRNEQPEESQAPPSASVATATMLADLSHHCVYTLAPRQKWPLAGVVCDAPDLTNDAASATASALASLVEVLGLRPDVEDVSAAPCGVVFSLSPTARHQRTRQAPATAVHGHMWSAGAACLGDAALQTGDLGGSSVSTLSRHTRVVPVVLVASLCAKTSATALNVLLFSEGPVHITRRATAQLHIQLISLWSPCSRCPAHASVFEYWRCESHARSSQSEPETLSTLKATLQRCARVYRRLQLRPPHPRRHLRVHRGTSSKPPPRKNAPIGGAGAAGARAAARGHPQWASSPARQSSRLSLVAYPSFSSPFLRDRCCSEPAEEMPTPYAWRLALIFRSPASGGRTSHTRIVGIATKSAPSPAVTRAAATLSARQMCLVSRRARRAHFQLARRFFGFLLMAPPPLESACGGAAARGRCRALGFQDRVTLLHLLGRPAYPLDYGLSRPSATAQQRRRQRSASTPSKVRAARQGTKRCRTPTDRTSVVAAPASAPLPSYVHIIEYYGNISNAACRVFVRAAHTDRKLPTLHSSVGTILVQCRWRQHREDSALCTPCIVRVGVVSSSAFFAQRFGCMVVPVWCCFPKATCETSGGAILTALANEDDNVLPVEAPGGRWTAVSLAHDTTAASRAFDYFLAPPEVADGLLRHSALLQRDDPPRQRAGSRHQRAFDLRQGRAAQELETLLYDPLACSPVHLIQWYA